METILENLFPIIVILAILSVFIARLVRTALEQLRRSEQRRARQAAERRQTYQRTMQERAGRRQSAPPAPYTYDRDVPARRPPLETYETLESIPIPQPPREGTTPALVFEQREPAIGPAVEEEQIGAGRSRRAAAAVATLSTGDGPAASPRRRVRSLLSGPEQVKTAFLAMELLRPPVSMREDEER